MIVFKSQILSAVNIVRFVIAHFFVAFTFLLLTNADVDAQVKDSKQAAKKEIKTFDKKGVRFKYPSDWKPGTDQFFSSTRLVVVNGPNNAIITLQFTENSIANSLKSYAKDYSEGAKDSLKTLDVVEQSFAKPAKSRSGFESISESLKLKGKNDDTSLTLKRVFLKKKSNGYSCFIVTQVSKRHLDKVTQDFETMIESLSWKNQAPKNQGDY